MGYCIIYDTDKEHYFFLNVKWSLSKLRFNTFKELLRFMNKNISYFERRND